MMDWFDPGTLENIAKATAAILDALAKLRDALSRRKKATRPADARALDKEVDALQADLQQLIDLLTKHIASFNRFLEAVGNLLGPMDAPAGEKNLIKWIELIKLLKGATKQLQEMVLTHERRLKALEHAPKDHPGGRVPKRKSRRR